MTILLSGKFTGLVRLLSTPDVPGGRGHSTGGTTLILLLRIFSSWILLMALFSFSIIYEVLQMKLKEAHLIKSSKPILCRS
jgi:hypothetical protein